LLERELRNLELHNFYSSPDKFRTIKSREMRWAGHVAVRAEKRIVCRISLVGKMPLGIP
jgi:hypothetical protein